MLLAHFEVFWTTEGSQSNDSLSSWDLNLGEREDHVEGDRIRLGRLLGTTVEPTPLPLLELFDVRQPHLEQAHYDSRQDIYDIPSRTD